MLSLFLQYPVFSALVPSSIALAIGRATTTVVSPAPTTTLAPTPNTATTGDASFNACNNINNCRTLTDIVRSCLTTMFVCVLVAVHPNIPRPKRKLPSLQSNWLIGITRRLRSILVVRLKWLMAIFFTILIPEMMLFGATQEFLSAWSLANALESAKMIANDRWEKNPDALVATHREVPRSCGSILLQSDLLLICDVGTQGERVVALPIPLQPIPG